MDSVYVEIGHKGFVNSLSLFYDGDLLGSYDSTDNPTPNVVCPEGQVITGLEFGCGAILNRIMFYCDSPAIQTLTPSEFPSAIPTTMTPSEVQSPSAFRVILEGIELLLVIIALAVTFIVYSAVILCLLRRNRKERQARLLIDN